MENERRTAASNLHRLAKAAVEQQQAPASVLHNVANAQRLLQKMQCHLIELEAQIEEQRATRQEVEANLAHYTALYEQAPVACYTFDRNGAIQSSNLRGASLLGRSRTQLHRQCFGEFISDDSSAIFSDFLQRVFAGEKKQTCEVTLLPTSQRPQMFVLFEAVAAADGHTCSAAAINITKRKQERLTAQHNYALLSRLSAQIPGILFQYRLDPDGSTHFPYVNESAHRMYHITSEQARGDTSTLASMVHPKDAAGLDQAMRRSASDLSPWRHEFRMLQPDHGVIWRAVEASPEKLPNGSILWHGYTIDISERKQTEEKLRLALSELEERRREAESISEAKSRFLNAASHDLRQPLYATQLFIDAMGDDALTPQQQETMQNLRLSIEAMSEQLQMLLEFSRLDMGNIKPQPCKISITSIYHKLEHTYAPIAREADVELRFHPLGGHVHSDLILVTRLLGNLIDNAIKFAPRGRILVCARGCAQGIRIEVRDNGLGIPPEHRQHIFEEYYQIDNPARNPQAGLGLGLSIALRISRLLKIPFALQSSVGRGSVFSVTLPTNPAASAIAGD